MVDREQFDALVDREVSALPPEILALLDETPLIVEDEPATHVLSSMGIRDPAQLCGLFTGVPLTERSVNLPFEWPTAVYVYRLGVYTLASRSARDGGVPLAAELQRQIRITVLHELGHLHGLGEEELEELGYG